MAQNSAEDSQSDSVRSYVYIPEVAREPTMWFKKVPRLGSYLAIPLIYESCLSDESLSAAIKDMIEVTA
jgi:hypothetical protein